MFISIQPFRKGGNNPFYFQKSKGPSDTFFNMLFSSPSNDIAFMEFGYIVSEITIKNVLCQESTTNPSPAELSKQKQRYNAGTASEVKKMF